MYFADYVYFLVLSLRQCCRFHCLLACKDENGRKRYYNVEMEAVGSGYFYILAIKEYEKWL